MTAALAETGSLVGQTVGGKFKVEAHIGSGAMGDVYRATHTGLGRTVALKVMRSDLSDETFVARFQREARAASALDHPNTVRVLDFGTESSGLAYIAMEFLNGRDLYEVIRAEHPLSPERIVHILGQALSAMKAAHRLGIVHRDIKPENIMVTLAQDDDGELHEVVKVCDFGIAKVIDTRAMQTEPGRALTGTGTLVGTPEYMSPEQARGEPLDARSDLYSMGIVLFQMLTSKVPFTSETPIGVVVKQVTDTPPRPSSLRRDVDPRLEDVCLRALEKRPEDRFQSAGEMASALRGLDPSAPLTSTRLAVASKPSYPDAAASAPRLPALRSEPRIARESDFGSRPTLLQDEPVLTEVPRTERSAETKRRPVALLVLLGVLLLGGAIGGVVTLATRKMTDAGPVASPSTSVTPSSAVSFGVPSAPVAHSSSPVTTNKPPPHSAPPVASNGKKLPPLPPASAAAKPVASAPTTPSATPPPESPPASPIAVEKAFVSVGRVDTDPSGARAAVSSFLQRATPSLSMCYRAAITAAGAAKGGTMTVALSIDEKGMIMSAATVPGPMTSAYPNLGRCFAGPLQNHSVGPVEHAATATVQVALVPPPP
ncbi:MAG: serine/threonine protein kinase [Myxococcales bacterium]|nr:serine/threonine protein kinase [Myxococcales bacterium]